MHSLTIVIMMLALVALTILLYGALLTLEENEEAPKRNEDNSSGAVACTAADTCRDRHTELCKNCKYNHYEPPKSYYEPKEEEE